MKKILIVEDETDINNMIKDILSDEYLITQAFSGTESLLLLKQEDFDLILLDYMLPGKSGEEVLSEYRKSESTPVIMITAVSDSNKVVELLNKGADDYIVKPFDIDILKARIKVQLRNTSQSKKRLQHKNMIVDTHNHLLLVNNQKLDITYKEYLIMKTLIDNPNKIFTKEALYKSVWEEDYFDDDNTINVHLSNLRRKINQHDPGNEYIETIWGFGVKLDGGE